MADDIEYVRFDNNTLATIPTYINGVMQPQQSVSMNGTVEIDFTTNTFKTVPNQGIVFATPNSSNGFSVSGTVTNSGANTYTLTYTALGNSQPTFTIVYNRKTPNNAVQLTYNSHPNQFDNVYYDSGNAAGGSPITSSPTAPTCFTSGTMIATINGPVAVEQLAVGDMMITASGRVRPVRWIGHRTLEAVGVSEWPLRIAAGAFGAGLPERELWLSPGHPVMVGADDDGQGGHLVPIMCLINGTTIERMPVDRVTYWHVELDAHDILLAEGLPVESYLDWGDRAFFTEGACHALANPDFVVPGLAGRCRPVVLDGPVVDAERRRLDAVFATQLVGACAWPVADGEAFLG